MELSCDLSDSDDEISMRVRHPRDMDYSFAKKLLKEKTDDQVSHSPKSTASDKNQKQNVSNTKGGDDCCEDSGNYCEDEKQRAFLEKLCATSAETAADNPDTLPAFPLRDTVNAILRSKANGSNTEELAEAFPECAHQFPMLFQQLCGQNIDFKMLHIVLDNYDKVHKNK